MTVNERNGGAMQTETLDMGARYSVSHMPGVAFYLRGFATRTVEISYCATCLAADGCECDDPAEDCHWIEEHETIPDLTMVRAVMVGDDREHIVDVDDLTVIGDEDYCSGCGQIGCGWC